MILSSKEFMLLAYILFKESIIFKNSYLFISSVLEDIEGIKNEGGFGFRVTPGKILYNDSRSRYEILAINVSCYRIDSFKDDQMKLWENRNK